MVLMTVVAIVGENKVRRHLFLELFKVLLNLRSLERKEAIAKFLNDDLLLAGLLQEEIRTVARSPAPDPSRN